MLAGLLFATEDASDRPGSLAATAPFGGLTLIEYQARLLVSAGAAQLVIVVARMTPELLGAINRIARRGGSVDAVRNAAEAAGKLHPLAHVLVAADGVVTSAAVLALLAGEDGDALLVVDDRTAAPAYERIGASVVWAGLARLDAARIADVAALPRDYDFQSTLLRVAAQAGAMRLPLSPDLAGVHAIEHDTRRLAERGRSLLSALVPRPSRWADRYVIAPVVRAALPPLIARTVPAFAPMAVAGIAAIASFGALYLGWFVAGTILAIAGVAGFATGAALSWLREEHGAARAQRLAAPIMLAIDAIIAGNTVHAIDGAPTGWVAAMSLVIAAALAERAVVELAAPRWWASPVAYPLVMLPIVIAGQPLVAIVFAGLYAAGTLAAAIEAIRANSLGPP